MIYLRELEAKLELGLGVRVRAREIRLELGAKVTPVFLRVNTGISSVKFIACFPLYYDCLNGPIRLIYSRLIRPFQFDLLLLGRPGWWNRVGR